MRTRTFNTNKTLDYPDAVVFSGDANYIELRSGTSTDSVALYVSATANGVTTNLSYSSDTNLVAIDLGGLFRSIGSGSASVTAYSYVNGAYTPVDSYTFTCTVCDGMTMAARYHGSTTVQRMYGTGRVSLYLPFASANNIDVNGATVASMQAQGVKTLTIADPVDGTIKISPASASDSTKVGDIRTGYRSSQNIVQRLKVMCIPDNAVTFTFTDTDGCTRLFKGELLSSTMKGAGKEWVKANVYRNPNVIITETSQYIELGVIDVEYGEYFGDIMYSQNVFIVADSMNIPATVDKMEYVTDGKTHDVKIKFRLQC